MEPLFDKLARQKVVKDVFAVIRGFDKRSDNWMRSASVPGRILLVLLFGGGCLLLPAVIYYGWVAFIMAILFLWFLNHYVILPINLCLICAIKQRWYIRLLNLFIFIAYLAGWGSSDKYAPFADLHFLYLMFVCQRLHFNWVWKIAKFTATLLVMTLICTIVWDNVVAENLYNDTDENMFGFLNPGDWVSGHNGQPIIAVDHIIHSASSMSDPDTIKKGWTVTDLWLVWLFFVANSLTISIGLALLPWMPRRLKDDASLCEN